MPAAEPGRETLPSNDGWGSVPTAALPQGTTGGSAASSARTVTVTNRKELIAALAWPDATPKLIYVKGTIDANVDEAGNPLNCKDYYRPDPATGELYAPFAFLAMYDPAGPFGKDKREPNGGQENARAASHAAQEARVHIRVPANTTLFGLADATIIGAWLDIAPDITSGNQPMNVIVRNLSIEDTADCFPEWSPSDGATGNWNSSYDSISIRNSTNVWIDHNRFADVRTRDESQPTWFGHRYQVHDGLLDITHESDYVTVSWNQFVSHDKTMLIGNSTRRPRTSENCASRCITTCSKTSGNACRACATAACTCTTIYTRSTAALATIRAGAWDSSRASTRKTITSS